MLGNTLRVFVDGFYLFDYTFWSGSDPIYSSGLIGVGYKSDDGLDGAYFDNVVVTGEGEPTIADAGLDQVVCNEAILDGGGSSCDPNNYIESYLWETDLDGDNTFETFIGNTVIVELDSVLLDSLDLYGKITEFRLTVTDNQGAIDTDTMLLAVAGVCDGWPEPNAEFNLKEFNIKNSKHWDYTTTTMFGTIDLPELNLNDGDMVDSRITIELFGALEGDSDLVISDEATLTVKDRKRSLIIKK